MKTKAVCGIILLGIFSHPLLAQTESINPGINASYLKENLVVEEWIERLEGEGREVFDNRDGIVDQLKLKPGMNVADIGSGTGAHIPYLSAAVEKKGKVYAVDIVPKFLEHLDHQISKNEWSNVETILCTERSVELPKASIDLAFICNVYHHFEYPEDSLASIHKALRKNGQLVLIDFKRIEGESSEWIMGHMRAGQEVFEKEIIDAGFKKVGEEKKLLSDNYMVFFEKTD